MYPLSFNRITDLIPASNGCVVFLVTIKVYSFSSTMFDCFAKILQTKLQNKISNKSKKQKEREKIKIRIVFSTEHGCSYTIK